MEFIQGTELHQVSLSLDQLRICLRQLADAILELHHHRFVHCDIKPANILLRPDGSPVLVDFGAAWDLTENKDFYHVSGTPYYMAPEAFNQKLPETGWDAYSLGITSAAVLGIRLAYDSLAKLREAKVSGEFEHAIKRELFKVGDSQLSEWIAGLVSSDSCQRLAMLDKVKNSKINS
jgi:serine/threonine-protein kinase